jgi:hypothetical protein
MRSNEEHYEKASLTFAPFPEAESAGLAAKIGALLRHHFRKGSEAGCAEVTLDAD